MLGPRLWLAARQSQASLTGKGRHNVLSLRTFADKGDGGDGERNAPSILGRLLRG